MPSKAERRAARERVAAYHEVELARLVARVASAIDTYRAGQHDVFAVDETIHQYGKAARELWKFCWLGGPTAQDMAARVIEERSIAGREIDWWSEVRVGLERTDLTPEERS